MSIIGVSIVLFSTIIIIHFACQSPSLITFSLLSSLGSKQIHAVKIIEDLTTWIDCELRIGNNFMHLMYPVTPNIVLPPEQIYNYLPKSELPELTDLFESFYGKVEPGPDVVEQHFVAAELMVNSFHGQMYPLLDEDCSAKIAGHGVKISNVHVQKRHWFLISPVRINKCNHMEVWIKITFSGESVLFRGNRNICLKFGN